MTERLYFEDIDIGVEYTSGVYTLTEKEIIDFSGKWDPWEFHTEQQEADASLFEGLAASGVHILCIANLLLHQLGVQWHIQALLGAEYRLPHPARVGHELKIRRTVIETRASKSRPEVGIVRAEDRLANQAGGIVLEMQPALLVAKKPR